MIGNQSCFTKRQIIPAAMMIGGLLALGWLMGNGRPRRSAPASPQPMSSYSVNKVDGKIPLSFEPNHGQAGSQVDFLARGRGYRLSLTATEAALKFGLSGEVKLKLIGANAEARAEGLEELPGKVNYFFGKDPNRWLTNISTYAGVRYREIYPGIALVYYEGRQNLEFDFVLAAGADPQAIQIELAGAAQLGIEARGDLVLRLKDEEIRLHKPMIYQEASGVRQEISGGFRKTGDDRIAFQIDQYDRSKPLIIDPELVYSTYLGGEGGEEGRGIALDGAGNIYVTGFTDSMDFPGPNFLRSEARGGHEVFVAKLNQTGSELIYTTIIGGGGEDSANGLAVDVAGAVYLTGVTSSNNFPTTTGALQQAPGSNLRQDADAFVAKLDPSGSKLIYSTYLGGVQFDAGSGIAVDGAGNAYVTGETRSINFPTFKPFQPAILTHFFDGGLSPTNHIKFSEAFVAKINPAGTQLVYSTYLGGSALDQGNGIVVDASGNVFVTGTTSSTDFPVTPRAYQTELAEHPVFPPSLAGDAFIAKLKADGSGLSYATYLGGNGYDKGRGVAIDSSGNAYITGSTTSTTFPTTSAFQSELAGGPIFKSVNGGANWSPSNRGLPDTIAGPGTSGTSAQFTSLTVNINALAVDPVNNSTIYAGLEGGGVFKSIDGGRSWAPANRGLTTTDLATGFQKPSAVVYSLVIDPSNPEILYAGARDGVYKSVNAGASWDRADAGLKVRENASGIRWNEAKLILAINPRKTAVLYANGERGVFKTEDGGKRWDLIGLPNDKVTALAIHPVDDETLYAGTDSGAIYQNAPGAIWKQINQEIVDNYETGGITALAIYPPAKTIYAGSEIGGIYWSFDGQTWEAMNEGLPDFDGEIAISAIAISPRAPHTVYVAAPGSGLFKRAIGDAVWRPINSGLPVLVTALVIDPVNTETLYAGVSHSEIFGRRNIADAFVAQLSPDGERLAYSTYLGGGEGDEGSSIVVDASGRVYVTGGSYSDDFPPTTGVAPRAPVSIALEDNVFLTRLIPGETPLDYSIHFGGGARDYGNSIALDCNGNAYLTGFTSSSKFPPAVSALQRASKGNEVFIAKFLFEIEQNGGRSRRPPCPQSRLTRFPFRQ